MSGISSEKLKRLSDKAYRDAYVAESITIGIPYQIRALREQRGWSQAELGRKAKKPANVICRLEDPESGGKTIHTLLEVASACDVALLVKFVSYSRFLKEFEDVSPAALQVPSFTSDLGLTDVPPAETEQITSNVANAFTGAQFRQRAKEEWQYVVYPIGQGLEAHQKSLFGWYRSAVQQNDLDRQSRLSGGKVQFTRPTLVEGYSESSRIGA